MSRIPMTLLGCLAVVGSLSLATTPAAAQSFNEPGYVRVSDQSNAGGPAPAQSCPQGQSCPAGNGYVTDGSAYCNECPPGCHCGRCAAQILDWFNPSGMHTYSPDHGWAPPVKRPIYRTGVAYRNTGFPVCWTGALSEGIPQQRLPSVYMPTDTTQLGYYYQHTPYWQPRPNAVPPSPRPSDWHLSLCEAGICGRHPAGVIIGTAPTVPAQAACPPGPVIDSQGVPVSPTPVPTAPPVPDAPASTLQPSAISPNLLPIR